MMALRRTKTLVFMILALTASAMRNSGFVETVVKLSPEKLAAQRKLEDRAQCKIGWGITKLSMFVVIVSAKIIDLRHCTISIMIQTLTLA